MLATGVGEEPLAELKLRGEFAPLLHARPSKDKLVISVEVASLPRPAPPRNTTCLPPAAKDSVLHSFTVAPVVWLKGPRLVVAGR